MIYETNQTSNNDELYHVGRKGMKWGRHIFGDKKKSGLPRRKKNMYKAKRESSPKLTKQDYKKIDKLSKTNSWNLTEKDKTRLNNIVTKITESFNNTMSRMFPKNYDLRVHKAKKKWNDDPELRDLYKKKYKKIKDDHKLRDQYLKDKGLDSDSDLPSIFKRSINTDKNLRFNDYYWANKVILDSVERLQKRRQDEISNFYNDLALNDNRKKANVGDPSFTNKRIASFVKEFDRYNSHDFDYKNSANRSVQSQMHKSKRLTDARAKYGISNPKKYEDEVDKYVKEVLGEVAYKPVQDFYFYPDSASRYNNINNILNHYILAYDWMAEDTGPYTRKIYYKP